MSKSVWISSVALVLLWAPLARADDVRQHADSWGRLVGVLEDTKTEVTVRPVRPFGRLDQIKLGKYRIGVGCRPPGEALRAQLDLADDQGLVVEKVMPDSPAAKAGIERHDVLLKAGEKPLKTIQDLIDAIEQAKETELAIELIRGGKRRKVTATPVERAEQARPEDELQWFPFEDDLEEMDKWFGRTWPRELRKGPMRFQFFGPGTILPRGAWPRPPLPGNMSISITKHGDKLAKIVVEQDSERWEVTEEELDKLPKKVRPHVERMLGRAIGGPSGRIRPFEFFYGPDDPESELIPSPKPREERMDKRLERRIEEMKRQIEKLQQSIDELWEKRPRLKKAPEEDPDSA